MKFSEMTISLAQFFRENQQAHQQTTLADVVDYILWYGKRSKVTKISATCICQRSRQETKVLRI